VSTPDPKPSDQAPKEASGQAIESDTRSEAAGEIDAADSGSVDVQLSGPLPAANSGSIDVQFSGPHLPASDGTPQTTNACDSQPIASGRVTGTVATASPAAGESTRMNKLADVAMHTFDEGVTKLGEGIETIGEGVSKLGEVSRKVPLVGSISAAGVARLGEGITHVGESLTELPRVVHTRRGRLLIRSLVVGFLLVASWIAIIVALQIRGTDSPDFRSDAEDIMIELSRGRPGLDKLYEGSSPRFQEIVRKERFIDDMLDLLATMGSFREIMAINDTLVTTGPTGRVGRIQLTVRFDKGIARSTISLHYDQDRWKLLGIDVSLPPELRPSQAQREERVAACKDPMDRKRCEIHAVSNHILEQLRDGHADQVWDAASDIFKKQEEKQRFVQIQAEHAAVLGDYLRVIAVTEAKVIGGTEATFDVLTEYAKSQGVRAVFGFERPSKTSPWQLRSFKRQLPMPRVDDIGKPGQGSGSGRGSAAPPPLPPPRGGSPKPSG
jgi:hypothetical protein